MRNHLLALLVFVLSLTPARPGNTLLGVGMTGGDDILGGVATAGYDPRDGSLATQAIAYAKAGIRRQMTGQSGEHFFVVPFGYQSAINDAHHSHTFASYVRVSGRSMRWFNISWLPDTFAADLKISVFGGPVTGKNFGLEETLDFARRGALRVGCWGPYEITPECYHAAERRIADLRSGRWKYIPNDHGKREREAACNCMHAVSDLNGELETYGGLLDIGIGYWGFKGTRHVVEHYAERGWASGVAAETYQVWKPVVSDEADRRNSASRSSPPSPRGRAD